MNRNLDSFIKRGLIFLAKEQKKNGIFLSFSSENFKNKKNSRSHCSMFPTALILSCLNSLRSFPVADDIRKKAAGFLLSQKSDFWSFNYWQRGSSDSKEAPYPDDLDDTFCSLAALAGHDPKIMTGKVLANAVTLLTAAEKKEGGPYFTWLVPQDAAKEWKDIDLAVNSNVGFFLSSQDIELENLSRLVEDAVAKNRLNSPYYYSPYSVAYFISRFYKGKSVPKIVSLMLSKRSRNGGWGNVLDTSLVVSALLNFGFKAEDVESSIGYLLKNQKEWKESHPFVVELIKGKRACYSGAPALTMAFILEALGKYQEVVRKEIEEKTISIETRKEKSRMHGKIIERMKSLSAAKGGRIRKVLENWTSELLEEPKGHSITLLPYEFKLALGRKGKKISQETILDLGVANALGWIAYSIYDNFYDKEGNSSELPAANWCLLNLTFLFLKVSSKREGFHVIFQETMERLEEANTWETENCKFEVSDSGFDFPKTLPDYGSYQKLADRSMGHALGSAAILSGSGYGKDSTEMKNAMAFFRNYIIAKQLNDDAHDWEEDIKKGNMSPAVVKVLENWKRKNKSKKRIEFEKDLDVLRDIFYREVILEISKDIIAYSKKARKRLEVLDILSDKSYFESLLGKEEKSGRMAIEEHKNALDFIRSFRG